MDDIVTIDVAKLFEEIGRYLAAVDTFRAADCEPTWLAEVAPCQASEEGVQVRTERVSRAH